jgi:hypothetical protein
MPCTGGEIDHRGLRSSPQRLGFREIRLDLGLQARRIGEGSLKGLDGGLEGALAPLSLTQREIQLAIGAVHLQGGPEQARGVAHMPLAQLLLPPDLVPPHDGSGDHRGLRR